MTDDSSYKKKYESLMECFIALQRDLDQAKSENARMFAEKVQWQAEKDKQLQIIAQTMLSANAKNNEYLEENKRLRQENEALRAGRL